MLANYRSDLFSVEIYHYTIILTLFITFFLMNKLEYIQLIVMEEVVNLVSNRIIYTGCKILHLSICESNLEFDF